MPRLRPHLRRRRAGIQIGGAIKVLVTKRAQHAVNDVRHAVEEDDIWEDNLGLVHPGGAVRLHSDREVGAGSRRDRHIAQRRREYLRS